MALPPINFSLRSCCDFRFFMEELTDREEEQKGDQKWYCAVWACKSRKWGSVRREKKGDEAYFSSKLENFGKLERSLAEVTI